MVINVLIISSDTDAAEQTALDPKKQTSLLLSVLAPVIIACTPLGSQGIPKLLVNRDRDVYRIEAEGGNGVVQTYCMCSQKPPLGPAQSLPTDATRWVHRHTEHLQQIPLLSRNPTFRLLRGKKRD